MATASERLRASARGHPPAPARGKGSNASSDPGALRDGLRQRRLVHLLRARRHRALRARPDAGRLRHRRALLLRGDGRDLRGREPSATPEAGGSSSFARHAFNETVSFLAAWAQMLNYVATIAISAFFVPHYLSIFWGPLRENPWDIVGGVIVVVLLVLLNVVGIQESTRINVLLAVIDFATQVLLVVLGFVLVFSPAILGQRHLRRRADVEPVLPRHPGGDARVHRGRDGLEPRRGGARTGEERPQRLQADRGRGLRHLLHAPDDRPLRDAGDVRGRRVLHGARREPARRAMRTTPSSEW